jgi:hypothetical protein
LTRIIASPNFRLIQGRKKLRPRENYSLYSSIKKNCFSSIHAFAQRNATMLCMRNLAYTLLLSLTSNLVFAMENKTFCVWDPVGRTGPVMTFYSDVIPKAQAWGLNIKFVA